MQITITAYRGEHGPEHLVLASKVASLTFGSYQAALLYATEPNDRRDNVICPRIIEANLSIQNPILNSGADPFIDLAILRHALGCQAAKAIALRFKDWIELTAHWSEQYADNYKSVHDLLRVNPAALDDLYCQAYPLLDDPQVITTLIAHGYDGAIYAGSAQTSDESEYRVFHKRQVQILDVLPANPAPTHKLAPAP